MAVADTTCEYVLDPTEPQSWGGSPGERCYIDRDALNEDGVWACPHEPADGQRRCWFHLPVGEKDDSEVASAFVDAINDALEAPDPKTRTRQLQFVGARFGTFDLSDSAPTLVADDVGIDLSYASVSGRFDWSGLTIALPFLYFIGTRFEAETCFADVRFGNYVAFLATTFEGDADFESAIFDDEGDFRSATFGQAAHFSGASFADRADFSSVEFKGDADFGSVEIGGDGTFSRAKCRKDFRLTAARIRGDADFRALKVYGETDFYTLEIEGETTLEFAEFDDVDSSGLL